MTVVFFFVLIRLDSVVSALMWWVIYDAGRWAIIRQLLQCTRRASFGHRGKSSQCL